ncbi:M20/M25/M40 family metallo-hydrolase [Pendulispora brunnea]|uniref:M20/M25/M40 family metallo-hydrolase n=1 Tax=Pendulispora brunnea TaxID=2905690 RepID=A0ABZ2JZZ3_9BACT
MARTTDPISLLEHLIRVDTHNPGGDEPKLAALLAEELGARAPDDVTVVEVPRTSGGARGAYVYARWGEPDLLVNAHIDTVPVNAGWTGNPFEPWRKDGRVYGLGACDTKGAIASILTALDVVRPRNVGVLFSGDEEVSSTCMTAFLASAYTKGIARAIVCEPTSVRVGVRHRGILGIKATLRGEGGHSSRADTMRAPLAELARVAVAWDDWGKAQRGRGPAGFTGMCTNIAGLEGGVAFNVVPERAVLTASFRPPPGANVNAVGDELVTLAKEHCPDASFDSLIGRPSFETRELGAFGPYLGARASAPIDVAFWTEAAQLSAAGIDAVVFGPGDIAQAHAPDEWVLESDLLAARDAFVQVFQQSVQSR